MSRLTQWRAQDATRSCLRARAECGGGLRLAAALWSCACAGSRGARALAAARLARHHYPAADWPLAALAALQLHWESPEVSPGALAPVFASRLSDPAIYIYISKRSTLLFLSFLDSESHLKARRF